VGWSESSSVQDDEKATAGSLPGGGFMRMRGDAGPSTAYIAKGAMYFAQDDNILGELDVRSSSARKRQIQGSVASLAG
jgi:hypothetical protein